MRHNFGAHVVLPDSEMAKTSSRFYLEATELQRRTCCTAGFPIVGEVASRFIRVPKVSSITRPRTDTHTAQIERRTHGGHCHHQVMFRPSDYQSKSKCVAERRLLSWSSVGAYLRCVRIGAFVRPSFSGDLALSHPINSELFTNADGTGPSDLNAPLKLAPLCAHSALTLRSMCGGQLRVIADIIEPELITKILDHIL